MPSDQQQIRDISQNMFPDKHHYLIELWRNAIEKPYGYLLLDLKPDTQSIWHVRANVLEQFESLPKEPRDPLGIRDLQGSDIHSMRKLSRPQHLDEHDDNRYLRISKTKMLALSCWQINGSFVFDWLLQTWNIPLPDWINDLMALDESNFNCICNTHSSIVSDHHAT